MLMLKTLRLLDFTNAFLAYKHFQKSKMKHSSFKVNLSNAMTQFKDKTVRSSQRNTGDVPVLSALSQSVHVLVPLKDKRYQRTCWYCQHDPSKPPIPDVKTSWHCAGCVGSKGQTYPLCDPRTGRNCYELHLIHGLPTKRRWTSVKSHN